MSRQTQKYLTTQEWKRVRLRVLARDGRVCNYCGQDANEVDHIVPLVNGGLPYDLDNLTACCRACNVAKSAKEVGVFLTSLLTPPAFKNPISPATTSSTPRLSIVGLSEPETK